MDNAGEYNEGCRDHQGWLGHQGCSCCSSDPSEHALPGGLVMHRVQSRWSGLLACTSLAPGQRKATIRFCQAWQAGLFCMHPCVPTCKRWQAAPRHESKLACWTHPHGHSSGRRTVSGSCWKACRACCLDWAVACSSWEVASGPLRLRPLRLLCQWFLTELSVLPMYRAMAAHLLPRCCKPDTTDSGC